ncbi:glycosyltransferase family 9 protein [bacterium]|nr:glycosyltransferase family 9 protein [candidate division CSSED10-310 bacterium]
MTGSAAPRRAFTGTMENIRYKIINRRKLFWVRTADRFLNAGDRTGWLASGIRDDLRSAASGIGRILAIRLAYIGDVIMTLPVIPALKKVFPNARIDFLTSSFAAPLLENIPGIYRVIPFDAPWFYLPGGKTAHLVKTLQAGRYDLGIDFRGDIRNIWHCLWRPGIPRRLSYVSGGGGAFLTHRVFWENLGHKVEYHFDILRKSGFDVRSSDPALVLTDAERRRAREILNGYFQPDDRPIAVHPGARKPMKQWGSERFAELVRKLREEDRKVVLLGGSGDAETAMAVRQTGGPDADLTGLLTIRELTGVLSWCSCLVCHDSAPMHIAAAVGTKVVALFGPSRPAETAPCGPGHRVIEGECRFKDNCDEHICISPAGHTCMASISVEHVINGVKSALGS